MTIPVPGLRKRPPVIVFMSMPVWEGVKGLMSVTSAGSKGSTVIVCAAGSSDSEIPLTVMPVFSVDTVSVSLGAVGEEESSPQPVSVPTTSSTETTASVHLLIFSTQVGYRKSKAVA